MKKPTTPGGRIKAARKKAEMTQQHQAKRRLARRALRLGETRNKPTTPGGRIAAARDRAGMTQFQLAVACGVGQTQIADWERDRHPAGPKLATLRKLAKGLGCKVFILVDLS
jgi:transcriptional regulator with XRE-family HTH domain